jgi:hypothetical protein
VTSFVVVQLAAAQRARAAARSAHVAGVKPSSQSPLGLEAMSQVS